MRTFSRGEGGFQKECRSVRRETGGFKKLHFERTYFVNGPLSVTHFSNEIFILKISSQTQAYIRNTIEADKNHIHHILNNIKQDKAFTVKMLISIQLAFSCMFLQLHKQDDALNLVVFFLLFSIFFNLFDPRAKRRAKTAKLRKKYQKVKEENRLLKEKKALAKKAKTDYEI